MWYSIPYMSYLALSIIIFNRTELVCLAKFRVRCYLKFEASDEKRNPGL